jgi:outer membrane protein
MTATVRRPQAFPRSFRTQTARIALAAALLGGSVALAPRTASAQTPGPRFAIIDVRRAISETEQGLRVQATLKKLFDSRQIELDGKQRQLQTDKEQIDKDFQAGKVNKDAVAKKYESLQRSAADLQTTMVEYQREMQRKETELTTPILQGIMEAVKRIAAQEGYEMIFEKSAVPYFRGDLELTDRAIQMYNSGQTGKGTSPGPATKSSPPGAPLAPAPAAKPILPNK